MTRVAKFSVGLVVSFAFMLTLLVSLNRERQVRQLAWQEEMKTQIREEVKNELTQQFQQEIDAIVANKVAAALAQQQLAKAETSSTVPVVAAMTERAPEVSSSKTNKVETPNIEQAIRRTVREVMQQYTKEMTAQELDQYVASGGLAPEVKIPGGIVKETATEEMRLAAVDKNKNKEKTADQGDKSGPKQGTSASTTAGKKPRAESLERTLAERGSILLPKGKLQVEQALTYAHFSSNRINIDGVTIQPILVVGTISVDKVNRDIFIDTTAFKYGLLRNLQTEVKIPFRYEKDSFNNTSSDGTITSETNHSTSGLGDITFSASRQIAWDSEGFLPDVVASLSVKTPSGRSPYNHQIAIGTGHWATSLGLVAAKSSDPAVVFGSLSYSYNFAKDAGDYGEIKPGDAIGYSLGTAIALSYQTAINFSFDQTITTKMTRNGNPVAGSFQNVANFKTGLNWAWNERFSTDMGVSFGLTSDSPDMTVDIRFPYTF